MSFKFSKRILTNAAKADNPTITQMEKEGSDDKFTNWQNMHRNPVIIYADKEAFNKSVATLLFSILLLGCFYRWGENPTSAMVDSLLQKHSASLEQAVSLLKNVIGTTTLGVNIGPFGPSKLGLLFQLGS